MVRVLIERRVVEGKAKQYEEMARDVRIGAMRREGYISGESLRDAADPLRYFTVSTWKDFEGWDHWVQSKMRRDFMNALYPTLAAPERITVLEHVG